MYAVSRKRSLIKSITWRVVASADTFLIAWFITGKFSWAKTISVRFKETTHNKTFIIITPIETSYDTI